MSIDQLVAVEAQNDVRSALEALQQKLEIGGEHIGGFVRGTTIWNPRIGMWSHFQSWKRRDKTDRHWNGFGFMRDRPRRRVIVEINPPVNGKYKTMQGAIALDKNSRRWLLHRGQLSIPRGHVSEKDFDNITDRSRAAVTYEGGRSDMCFPITNIDGRPRDVQDELASYVLECKRIRQHYIAGGEFSSDEQKINQAEDDFGLNPEKSGSYIREAQDEIVVQRQHARVWEALSASLKKIGVRHTTDRVGRWGPDLRTVEKRVLFEIKISTSASDLQKAVGQLLMYDHMLGGGFAKVLVLPDLLEGIAGETIRDLDISILRYRQIKQKVTFVERELRNIT